MPNDIVLQLDPSPTNGRNSEATFVTLDSGRILLIWSKFIGENHSDFGAGVIACRWSDDGGRTWSDRERVLVKKDRKATNVMSPSALRLKDGRIALLVLRKEGMDQCIPWIRFSDDELKTLSDPVRCVLAPAYYVVNNDRLIQLKSGRLIMPISLHRYRGPSELKPMDELPGDTNTHYPRGLEPFIGLPGIILFYFSDDGGKTWLESRQSFYRCFPDGSGLEEPGIVETKRGLWCYSRTGIIGEHARKKDVRQWSSFSKDGGQTWTEPEPSEFVSPCSPMQVKRMTHGPRAGKDLLAIWNDHSGRFRVSKFKPISWARTPLVCAISSDEGKTWKKHRLLESAPDQGFCYPACHFTDDAVLMSYNAGGAQSRNPLDTQRVRRITYDWLYE
jgi:sialidase-1